MTISYQYHIFMCQNQRPEGHFRGCCQSKDSEKLLNHMKARVKELGIASTRVNKAGCLDQCEGGPAMVIYPEGTWYSPQTIDDIEEIIDSHLIKGLIVERLVMASNTAEVSKTS